MKEMCRNFICSGHHCQQMSDSTHTGQNTAAAAVMPDTSMGDCSECVKERIGLAQALVPFQSYEVPKGQEQSLVCGTVFSELSMPYCSGWNLYRFQKEV